VNTKLVERESEHVTNLTKFYLLLKKVLPLKKISFTFQKKVLHSLKKNKFYLLIPFHFIFWVLYANGPDKSPFIIHNPDPKNNERTNPE